MKLSIAKYILILSITLFCISCDKTEQITSNLNDDCQYIESSQIPNYILLDGHIGFRGNSTIKSFDDQILICGIDSSSVMQNMLIIKTDMDGKVIWRKSIGEQISKANGMACDEIGNIYVVGDTKSDSMDFPQIAIFKLNGDGDILWNKIIEDFEFSESQNITIVSQNEFIVVGRSGFSPKFFKLDSNGKILNSKLYQDAHNQPTSILKLHDGNILMNLHSSNPSLEEVKLINRIINSDGDVISNNEYGTSFNYGYYTIETKNNDLITVGSSSQEQNGKKQVWILKTNKEGEIIWEKSFGHNEISEVGYRVQENIDGSYIIAGYSNQCEQNDNFIFHVSNLGDSLQASYFIEDGNEQIVNLLKTEEDKNIVTGVRKGNIFFTIVDNTGN